MSAIPDGALLQRSSKEGVSYVYFPSYYYDKDATTRNKEKQRRLYIGKVQDGKFIPNKLFRDNPNLGRSDAAKPRDEIIRTPAPVPEVETKSIGSTALLFGLAEKVHLTQDLAEAYGQEDAEALLTLGGFMAEQGESALSLCEYWQRDFCAPCGKPLSSQHVSRLLQRIGSDETALRSFFRARTRHVRAHEYLSYDSTKIASESEGIDDVRWAPSKAGVMQQEIGLAVLCGQKSRMPVMFRVIPGNVPDVMTVRDLLCRWEDLGIDREATAVLDRGYQSKENIAALCRNSVKFIVGIKSGEKLAADCIDEHMPEFWMSKHYLGDHEIYGVTSQQTVRGEDGARHEVWIHAFRSDRNCARAMQAFESKLRAFEENWSKGIASRTSKMFQYFIEKPGKEGERPRIVRNFDAIDSHIRYKGFFAFASNAVKTAAEALDIYRGRDCVEKTFSGLQSGLDLTSAGVHSNEVLKGKLLVCMIALTMHAALVREMEQEKVIGEKKYGRLFKEYTLKELLRELRDIKRISAPGMEDRISEITSRQELVYARVGVPKPA